MSSQHSAQSAVIGLLGVDDEPHCNALQSVLEAWGHRVLRVNTQHFFSNNCLGLREGKAYYQGQPLEHVQAWYLKSVLSPLPPITLGQDGEYRLYDDFLQQYMEVRSQAGFLLSWLLSLAAQSPMVNPPDFGHLDVVKPHQLFLFNQAGIPVPRTLVTNDPAQARDFLTSGGDFVYKPAMGGALCHAVQQDFLDNLDLIRQEPVILQEYVPGVDLRITCTREKILSACSILVDGIDFRGSAAYLEGENIYENVELTEEEEVLCFRVMESTGYHFSAMDLRRTPDGRSYVLEANYAPAWLWLEQATGAPIAQGLADYLVRQALAPRSGLANWGRAKTVPRA